MSTEIYLYSGCTAEDVYAALDDRPSDYIDLDTMSSPQVCFLATGYSEEKVREFALELWEGVAEFYQDPDEPTLFDSQMPEESFSHLQVVTSAKIVEPHPDVDPVFQVQEVTEVTYYAETDMEQNDPLIKIVVQKRLVRA